MMDIHPFTGVGDVRFGDTRERVRNVLGKEYETFHKDVGENESDAYDELGLHVYYDDRGEVEFIEAFGNARLTLGEVLLLGRSVDEVDRELRRLGHAARTTDVGLQYDSVGISLTAPSGTVEGVGIYRRDYHAL